MWDRCRSASIRHSYWSNCYPDGPGWVGSRVQIYIDEPPLAGRSRMLVALARGLRLHPAHAPARSPASRRFPADQMALANLWAPEP